MRTADLITSAVLMLLGGVVLYDALRLGIGWGVEGPGSGFFPFWLAVILIAVSFGVFVQALRRGLARPFVTAAQLRPVLQVLVPVAAFIAITDPPGPYSGLGLYVAGALYLGFYMRWVGRHDWRAVVALSIAVPVITFLVFERWFLVPMPKGPLETWLGY
ncbi:MAG: tripartite tricarboxylate transporter TctB family protein [Candidatus Rokubacteria bacterium]|nr:tripartite tricarboxylate transporter TctB family protein [Candidatus Rokubacteria bacterium]